MEYCGSEKLGARGLSLEEMTTLVGVDEEAVGAEGEVAGTPVKPTLVSVLTRVAAAAAVQNES